MADEYDQEAPGGLGSPVDDLSPREPYRAQLIRLHESGALDDAGYERRLLQVDEARTWGDLEGAVADVDRGAIPVPTRRKQRRELPADDTTAPDEVAAGSTADLVGETDDEQAEDDDEPIVLAGRESLGEADPEDDEDPAEGDLEDDDLDDDDLDEADLEDEDDEDLDDEDLEDEDLDEADLEDEDLDEDDPDLDDEDDLDDDEDDPDLDDDEDDPDLDDDEDDDEPPAKSRRGGTAVATRTPKDKAAARATSKTAARTGDDAAGKGKKGRPTPKRPTAVAQPARTGPIQFIKESIDELRKVVYPTSQQLWTYFAVVLVFVLFVIGYTFGLDQGFGQLMLLVFGQ